MATVDLNRCSPEQRKVYQRMSAAGKGDAPRNIYSREFRANFDRIRWDRRRDRSQRESQS